LPESPTSDTRSNKSKSYSVREETSIKNNNLIDLNKILTEFKNLYAKKISSKEVK
jgi:hypothetical protein